MIDDDCGDDWFDRPTRPIRVIDLAYELDMTTDELLAVCGELGLPHKTSLARLNAAYADMLRRRCIRDGLTKVLPPTELEGDFPVGTGVDAAMEDRYRLVDGEDAEPAWEQSLRAEAESRSEHDLDGDEPDVADEWDGAVEPSRCDACDDPGPYLPHWGHYACCCVLCRSAPRLPGAFPLCAQCQVDRLCRVCGQAWRRVKGRCEACRKYYERNGVERPRSLIKRRADKITLAELQKAHDIAQTRLENPYFEPRRR